MGFKIGSSSFFLFLSTSPFFPYSFFLYPFPFLFYPCPFISLFFCLFSLFFVLPFFLMCFCPISCYYSYNSPFHFFFMLYASYRFLLPPFFPVLYLHFFLTFSFFLGGMWHWFVFSAPSNE